MPNSADHSVKTARRDRESAINRWVFRAGILAGTIGALAAVITGGTAGLWVGLTALTTIIFLQMFHSSPVRGSPGSEVPTVLDTVNVSYDLPRLKSLPILVLSVSSLGRIRAVIGQEALLPGVRTGAEIDRYIDSRDDQILVSPSSDSALPCISRLPAEDGEWILLIPRAIADKLAETAIAERTRFFAGLGHDLKSPLNAVIGFADIMDAELRGPMPEAYQDYPALIRESGETLLRLVEDILDFARSETGAYALDVTAMDIAASGESVLRQSQVVAEQAGVQIQFVAKGEVMALADPQAVRRIWDNLVSNAIKYSAPGDKVVLTAMQQGDVSVLQVRDTGAGMDADDLARIAEPFAQGRNARGRAGTGLGLAMVRRLAEMQAGRVEIRTAPGAGTTVTVRLPGLAQNTRRAAE